MVRFAVMATGDDLAGFQSPAAEVKGEADSQAAQGKSARTGKAKAPATA